MFAINNLTTAGNQTSLAVLADGSTVTLTFRYRPAIQRWTVDVTRGVFVALGVGLSSGPNLLRIWRHIIPFGLKVSTADGTDPFMADDLAGTPPRVTITVLDGSNGRTDLEDAEAAIA
ncbi:MAG: hypothetical protein V4510_10045 [bacterium]